MTKAEKLPLCSGCRNDFYNGQGAKECWSLKDAKPVIRWKQGWWTQGDVPSAFVQVRTLSCHHATGRYAMCEKLPNFAVDPVYLKNTERNLPA